MQILDNEKKMRLFFRLNSIWYAIEYFPLRLITSNKSY